MSSPHQLIDTHAHLDDESFSDGLSSVLDRSREAGVSRILTIGTTAKSSAAAVELASQWPELSAAVGIQPNCGAEATLDDWQAIVELAAKPEVCASAKPASTPIGITHRWNDSASFLISTCVFLSRLPCHLLYICVIAASKRFTCCRQRVSGDHWPVSCIRLPVTLKRLGNASSWGSTSVSLAWSHLRNQMSCAIARQIPFDRILIETDSPYLTPHPHRGAAPTSQPCWSTRLSASPMHGAYHWNSSRQRLPPTPVASLAGHRIACRKKYVWHSELFPSSAWHDRVAVLLRALTFFVVYPSQLRIPHGRRELLAFWYTGRRRIANP